MAAGVIFVLILILLLVIFTLQNSTLITVKLLFWQISDIPLILALIVSLILGFVIAFVLYYPGILKLKSQVRAQQEEIDELTEEPSEKDNHPEGIEITGGSEKGFFS